MACTSDARRRLFLSIIRAPTLLHQPAATRPKTGVRSISTTAPCQSNKFSVTFGPKIDSLLEPRKPRAKGSRKARVQQDVSSEDVTHVANAGNAVGYLYGKKTVSRNSSHAANNFEIDRSLMQPAHLARTEMSSSDGRTTLELSGDAYDTISRPRDRRMENAIENAGGQHPTTHGSISQRNLSSPRDHNSSVHIPMRRSRVETTTEQRLEPRVTDERESWRTGSKETLEKKTLQELNIKREPWRVQKDALQRKFGDAGWNPRKKLSPDAMEGIRTLHEQDPQRYSTDILSQQFKVSPEAIRRILKSKWRPSSEQMDDRRQRWARRHDRIWDQQAALGLRPERTKNRESEGPEAFEEEVQAKQMLGHL